MNRRYDHIDKNDMTDITDYGPEPFAADVYRAALRNNNYRTALWTGDHLQMTLMSIPAGGEVGLEVHPDDDQFLRVEDGRAAVKMGKNRDKLNYQKNLDAGGGVFVPAGTWHNVINIGNRTLKLSSIYAPPHHVHGVVDKSKEDADRKED